jgi:hypothetical protein
MPGRFRPQHTAGGDLRPPRIGQQLKQPESAGAPVTARRFMYRITLSASS